MTQTELNFWLRPSARQHRNPNDLGAYQDLSKRHDWPVKKAMVHLPISLQGNSERISGNSLSSFGGGGGVGGGRTRISALLSPQSGTLPTGVT